MNKQIYYSIIVLCILIILYNAYDASHRVYKESFIPKNIKEMYRPFIRDFWTGYERIFSSIGQKFTNVFRKMGIF